MAEPSLAQAAVTIGFAALAGGITNAVAVWMLFHPHARRGFRGLSIQGAIPKNRARLARTIGRTVGERLLTSDDLARQLASPEIRGAFADTLRGFVRDLVETERDTLRDLLPPALIAELEALSDRIGPRLADRVAAWAASPDCREHLEGLLARARATYGDRPMGEVLTAARRTVLRERVGTWVAQGVEHPDVERAIRGWLERRAAALADDRTPLFDRLPPGLVRAAERAIAGYLPVALERLGAVLRDPDARARIDRAVHDLFRRFLNDLMLHERLVARLVVTERTITRLLDTFGREGADELARLLDEPAMRTHVARNINDAVVTFLRRPLAEHIEALGPDRVAGLTDAAARQILGALRDPGLREAAIARMDRALAAAEDRTWSDLLDRLPPDRTGPPLDRRGVGGGVPRAARPPHRPSGRSPRRRGRRPHRRGAGAAALGVGTAADPRAREPPRHSRDGGRKGVELLARPDGRNRAADDAAGAEPDRAAGIPAGGGGGSGGVRVLAAPVSGAAAGVRAGATAARRV
jgi:uncharacterized membrane-anchored protein YjiN (DUF445 family)